MELPLSNKRAFTMVEIVISLALVCGAVILWTYILSVSRANSNNLDNEQVFNTLRASLLHNLKSDMRSAISIKPLNENAWEIETVKLDESATPSVKKVIYELAADGKKVSMSVEGRVKTYDFSNVLDGKKRLNFKIWP
jgi:type II secretory pathway pseudopilin PulG